MINQFRNVITASEIIADIPLRAHSDGVQEDQPWKRFWQNIISAAYLDRINDKRLHIGRISHWVHSLPQSPKLMPMQPSTRRAYS